MKKTVSFIVFCFLLIILDGKILAQSPMVKDIFWDEDKRELSYILSQDSVVKIRVGRESGPVYETLVNLEERKAGQQKQTWSGKDTPGIIDFIKFGELHFCVDPMPKPEKDLELLVDLSSGLTQNKGVFTVNQNISLNIDLEEPERKNFEKSGFEVRTFIDGELVKVDNAPKVPYTLNLDLKTYSFGEHLLSINIWPFPERSKVAYKNMLICYEEQHISNMVGKKNISSALAFCQYVDGYWQIYIAELDGTGAKRITTSPIDKSDPAFSLDGKMLAYVTNTGELWIFDREDNQQRKIPLPVNCAQPSFSSDEKKLVFISHQDLYHGDTELWTVDIQDGSLNKIISRPWLQYNPLFSPDGNYVIFVDGPELHNQEIRKINLETKDITQLTDNWPYDYDLEPCFSPDAEFIFYSSNQDRNYDIWVMDKFGRNPQNLTKNLADDKLPKVTDDGKVYFLSDRDGSTQIWRMDRDGKNPKQITNATTDLRCLSLCEVK